MNSLLSIYGDQRKCRLCLVQNVDLFNIFEEPNDETNEVPLRFKMMVSLSLMVSLEDQLPKEICKMCLEMVKIIFNFKESCFNSQVELSKQLNTAYTNVIGTLNEVAELDVPVVHEQSTNMFCEISEIELQDLNDSDINVFRNEANAIDTGTTDDRETDCASAERSEPMKDTAHIIGGRSNLQFQVASSTSDNKESDSLDADIVVSNGIILGSTDNYQAETYEQQFKCTRCNVIVTSLDELNNHWDSCRSHSVLALGEDDKVSPLKEQNETSFTKSTVADNVELKSTPVKEIKARGRPREASAYICDTCGKSFKQPGLMMKHKMRVHLKQRPYNCLVCSKKFSDGGELRAHSKIHTGDEPYMCLYCDKYFLKPSSLTIHIRSHTGEKPHQCAHCPMRFTQMSGLIAHERTHTGEKPFNCSFCLRSFMQKSTLKKHEEYHNNGAKLYQCETCARMYPGKDELNAHERAVHSGSALPETCQFCSAHFHRAHELSNHILSRHSQQQSSLLFECEQCGGRYRSALELKSHIHQNHLYSCSYCKNTLFTEQQTLQKHCELFHCDNLNGEELE